MTRDHPIEKRPVWKRVGTGQSDARCVLILILSIIFSTPIAALSQTGATAPRQLKIAVAHFSHEATTFSPEKVGIDGFTKPNPSGERLLAFGDAIRGFVKFAREHGVLLVPLESPGDVIGGSSKGWITGGAFEHYAGLMLRDLKASLPVDAVYLSLHGAAAVEGVARPESELARRVRNVVGPKVPIAGTFDPHGNEDEEFLRHANFSLVMKYFPHYDGRLQGERAARLLIRAARGDYLPATATRRPGIITPTVLQWTGQQPWMRIVQRALTWEARERDVYVSYFFGFPWSDVPDVGATFQVMTNGDQKLADRIAEDMSAFMWRNRKELFSTPILSPADAVKKAITATRSGDTPVVLADYSDRAGDATHILAEIIRQGLEGVIYATLRDERTLAALAGEGAKEGDPFDRKVGGFVISAASGEPVRIQGRLVFFGWPDRRKSGMAADERVAVVEFGRGNRLVITPELMQVTDPAMMNWSPIDPGRFTTWVLKSRAHFRRGFDDNGYAKTILIVDAPGPYLGTVHLDALPYRNVDLRKLFPYSAGGLDAVRGTAAP
jgi:microcystin degradation protein MlrC